MDSIVQVITTTATGMAAGTAWFSKDAREYAEKHLSEQNVSVMVNGKEITASIVPKDSRYLFTNLHVVNGASTVCIRMPSLHMRDIQVDVVGYSDLDVACLRLSGKNLKIVQERIGEIPELEMIDSDTVMPKHDEVKKVYIRAYPLGEMDSQYFSTGVVSGIKHAMGQEYLITDIGQFNQGVSGGPLLHEGKVVGMNVMKLVQQGVSGMNLHIPSNRVKILLPYLVDNSVHDLQRKTQEIAMSAIQSAGMLPERLQENAKHLFTHVGMPIETEALLAAWEEHAFGGFNSKDGEYTKVTFAEWYENHVHDKPGGHALLKKVIHAIINKQYKQVKNMRRFGFENYLCQNCATEPCEIGANIELEAEPRVIHMPRMHFGYSTTGEHAKSYYETEHKGVIVSEIFPGGPKLKEMDYLYGITTDGHYYDINNFGEWFNDGTQSSLKIHDIIARTKLGTEMVFHIVRDKEEQEIKLNYDLLKDEQQPEVRVSSGDKVVAFQGIAMKQLRLQDVATFGLKEYLNPHKQMEKKFIIAAVDPRSDAFHEYNLSAGQIIQSVNGNEIESIEHLCEELKSEFVVIRAGNSVSIFKQ